MLLKHSNERVVCPKLSILVTAYNIAPYIAQCLESILTQNVNFCYEILLADDCSTDNTRNIIRDYERKHPELIKVFYNETNLGYSRNLFNLFGKAKGELIIQIDGDDYITDNSKLQSQVDILDQNTDYAICFHNWASVDSNGKNSTINDSPFVGSCILPKDYLLHHNLGPGNLVMIRRSALPEKLPDWLPRCSNNIDYAIHCLAATEGNIYYIDQVMTAYRKHPTSITSLAKTKSILEMRIFTVKSIAKYYQKKGLIHAASFLISVLPDRYMKLGYFYLSEKDILNFIKFFGKGFLLKPNLNLRDHKDMIYSASPMLAEKIKKSFFLRAFQRSK